MKSLAGWRPSSGRDRRCAEVDLGIERIFSYAAWADKFDGAVHNPPFRTIAIAMNEPIGTVGIICPNEVPLLGFLSLVMPALAVGNTVIAVPSETYPLIIGDLYQLFDTSDVPGGAVNIVTGSASQLLKTLAEHDNVDAVWSFADEASAVAAKAHSVGNLKQVWTNEGPRYRLVQFQTGGRPVVPGACYPGEEYLGAVRGVSERSGPSTLLSLPCGKGKLRSGSQFLRRQTYCASTTQRKPIVPARSRPGDMSRYFWCSSRR